MLKEKFKNGVYYTGFFCFVLFCFVVCLFVFLCYKSEKTNIPRIQSGAALSHISLHCPSIGLVLGLILRQSPHAFLLLLSPMALCFQFYFLKKQLVMPQHDFRIMSCFYEAQVQILHCLDASIYLPHLSSQPHFLTYFMIFHLPGDRFVLLLLFNVASLCSQPTTKETS